MKGTHKAAFAVLAIGAVVMPGIAFGLTNLQSVIDLAYNFINALIPFIIALAVLWFIIGVFQYVTAGDDAEKQKAGRDKIIWGIIAIAVMVSVWGLVHLLTTTAGLNNTTTGSDVPTVPAPPTGF